MNERGVGVRGRWRRGVGRAAVLAACAGTLWLAGCGEDADERTLTDASIKLASLSAGAGAPIPDQAAQSGFQAVIGSLQGLTGGDGAVAADASVLVSSAQRGLGLRAAGKAVVLQREMLTMFPSIRAQLEAWSRHNSAAQAAAAYDPTPEFARIDRDVRARQDEADKARAERARIDKQISELIAGVTSRMAQSGTFREQAGALQLQIAKVSATEGLRLTEQIRELSRQADGLEREARELKAQADNHQVELHGAEVSIGKLESQIKLLAESRASVQTRQSASQARAAQARGDAQQAAGVIASLVDTATGSIPPMLADAVAATRGQFEGTPEELFGDAPAALTPFVEQAFTPAVEEAARQLQTAAQTARKANTLRRSSSQVAVGEAQQSLGEVHWNNAAGLDAYAQMLEELAGTTPPLPSGTEYAARAKAARAGATEAKRAAFEAYQSAKSAYEASGAKAEVATQIEEVSRKLNDISRVVGAGVMDAEALNSLQDPGAEEPADEPAPEEPADEPTADADPVEQLRSAIRTALEAQAAGDYEAVIGFMHPATDDDQDFVDASAGLLRGIGRLNSATEEAFGQSFSAWLAANPDPMLAGLAAMADAGADQDPDSMDLRVQGDEGVALTGIAEMPEIKFRRVGGEWKQVYSVEELKTLNPMAATGIAMLPKIAAAYESITPQVESGDLGSNAEVANAMKAEIMSLMQNPGGG
ncbi:MAG: hypothetical protein IT431_06880 [Phycisphaerales bacterium]|nr:hypothetical protein [Phycisphaerales bacterium]